MENMDVDLSNKIEDIVHLKPSVIQKACSKATEAHRTNKPYLVTDKNGQVIISFPGTWTVADWYSTTPFGLTKINQELFPSLKSLGLDELANVNQAFQTRFEALLRNSELEKEVNKANKKQIVFTGHSSGASLAILATLWLLESRLKSNVANLTKPICLTFGAPLVGDKIFHHAIQRQNWSGCFVNFTTKCDIVSLILLAPLASIEQQFQPILEYLKSNIGVRSSVLFPGSTLEFCKNVMIKASYTVSYAASKLMGSTNMLDNLTSFDVPSPYRPFGTYVFLAKNETACVLRNPDAVLQLLFYSCQVEGETYICNSLNEHLAYQSGYFGNSLSNNIINLDLCLENLPLASGIGESFEVISKVLDDLGVSTRGRICLLAAGELKKQKEMNAIIINGKKGELIDCLKKLEEYKAWCELHGVCYYDAFKLSLHEKDFSSNTHRLELAGLWDDIIDMLKIYRLPDDFEGNVEWIQLGTDFRRIMEPLDIANYYRHDKNDDTGPYLNKARPKRYRFTQRWLEHFKRESCAESCVFAEVEEFRLKGSTGERYADVLQLERNIVKWSREGAVSMDLFLKNSTLVKWWMTLKPAHRATSVIAELMTTAMQ